MKLLRSLSICDLYGYYDDALHIRAMVDKSLTRPKFEEIAKTIEWRVEPRRSLLYFQARGALLTHYRSFRMSLMGVNDPNGRGERKLWAMCKVRVRYSARADSCHGSTLSGR